MTQQLDEATLRAQLAEQYQHLEAIGLNELSSGNVSCRLGDNMLISPSGATGSNITPQHVVEVTLDGEWSGEREQGRRGGGEWQRRVVRGGRGCRCDGQRQRQREWWYW